MVFRQREAVRRPAPARGIAGPRRPDSAATTQVGVGADLLELQRRYGNQYVARLVGQLRQEARDAAVHGVRGAGRPLPHAERVQQALGSLGEVRAFTDASARTGCRDLGAEAYTIGNKIAFASSRPDLRTVAHEAVHVLQQRAGQREGNHLEQRAEAAADAIEHGRSPAGFLPGPGSQRSSAGPAPAVQAKVSIKEQQSLIGSLLWSQPPRELQTARELGQFLRQHKVSVKQLAQIRHPFIYNILPRLLNEAARRMISDEQDRVYDDTEAGARELASAIVDEAYSGSAAEQGPEQSEQAPYKSFFSASPQSYGLKHPGRSTSWTFDQLTALASATPVPNFVGDYKSRQIRATMAEHTPENPVQEGIKDAFTGRAEAVTRPPQNPQKAVKVLDWADYYFTADGDKDLQKSMDIAASKMSQDEAKKFKEDFEKLKLDQEMKLAASLGASVVVSQGIGAIPHPAAQAVKYGWMATGGVAVNNKIGDIADKLDEFEKKHPKAFQVLKERRDEKLAPVRAAREERHKQIRKDVEEQTSSPFG